MKKHKYRLDYNGKDSGKRFFTKKDAQKEWQRLWDMGLIFALTKLN